MMRQSSEPYDRVAKGTLVLASYPMRGVCACLSEMSRRGFYGY